MKKILVSTTFILLALTPFLFGNFTWNQNVNEHQSKAEEDSLEDHASEVQNYIVFEDSILIMEDETSVSNNVSFEDDAIENWDELEFVTISSQRPNSENSKLLSRPNPFQDFATLELKTATENGEVKLFDHMGTTVLHQNFNGSQFEIQREGLQSGNYFYTISDNGHAINAGKMIIS